MKSITNSIILPLGLFFLTLLWCNFVDLNLPLSIFLCLTVSFVSFFVLKRINKKARQREKVSKLKADMHKNFCDYLLFSPSPSKLFQQCYMAKGKSCIVLSDNRLITACENGNTFIELKFVFGAVKNIDIANLSKAAQLNGCKNAICFCIGFDSSAVVAANLSPVPITLNDLEKTIDIIQQSGVEIEIKPQSAKQKKKMSGFLAIALHKSRSKYFFWCSVFLAINSLIVPYALYYLISSSLLMALSMYCKFNKRYNVVAKT